MIIIFLLFCIAESTLTFPIRYNGNFKKSLLEYIKNPSNKNLKSIPTIDIKNKGNEEYSILITIGTPGNTFNLKIDTASTYIWVQSSGCTPHTSGSTFFDVRESSSYNNLNETVFINYTSSNATGILSSDLFNFGDKFINFNISQNFVVADHVFGLEKMLTDGIVGFGLNKFSNGTKTLMETLKASGNIVNSIFSLYLNDDEYDKNSNPQPSSVLTIGGYDNSYILNTTSLGTKLNVTTSKGYWEVSLNSVSLGSDSISIKSTSAIFDSSKGYITAPSDDLFNFIEWFFKKNTTCNEDNEGLLLCNCENINLFPTLKFGLGANEIFELLPQSYMLKSDNKCLLLIVSDNSIPNIWRLGGPFLRKFYSVYDIDSSVVTLFPAKISEDNSQTEKEDFKWIIVFFLVLLFVVVIVLSVFLYLFCCRRRYNFDEGYRSVFTAKYNLPPHYHRTAVRYEKTGETVPDIITTSRQNRVFPGIASNT